MAEGPMIRTVNLDLGNAAELNLVAINASYITFVKLSGAMSSEQRRMEIHLTDGGVIGMGFDDPDRADEVFGQVIESINRTIPDHPMPTIKAPQPGSST